MRSSSNILSFFIILKFSLNKVNNYSVITVENCGKIIDKKHTLNLESSKAYTFKQESQITKKVSPFLIMTFQRHFSQVFA